QGHSPGLAGALLAAREETLMMLGLLLSAWGVAHAPQAAGLDRVALAGPDRLAWIVVLLVQSVPYASSLLMSLMSAFPLPGRLHLRRAGPVARQRLRGVSIGPAPRDRLLGAAAQGARRRPSLERHTRGSRRGAHHAAPERLGARHLGSARGPRLGDRLRAQRHRSARAHPHRHHGERDLLDRWPDDRVCDRSSRSR